MDGVCKGWFLAVVVCWCFLSIMREKIAVESSHVVYPKLQSSSPQSVDRTLLPRYHFRPPRHWINDPNAPLYYKGIYHLFYQYNPYGSVWGNIVWGHSISTDLINWKALDPAIYPSIPSDIYGCWSGSATILPGDKPAILYTGQMDTQLSQTQNIAFPANLSDPYLREWTKPEYNPIMTAEENGLNRTYFRDPSTAWYHPNGYWALLVASKRVADNRGLAVLYRSKDFVHWVKARHPLHSVKDSGMWECIDFYPVASKGKRGLEASALGPEVKHVLKVSLDETRYDYYTLGTYHPRLDKYVPFDTSPDNLTGLRYDYGNFYASKTFYDPAKHRRILWGWANESDARDDDINKGWAGIQLIPRRVWLHRNGRQLLQWPVEEFDSLRQKHVSIRNKNIPAGGASFEVKDIQTAQAEVEITFDIPSLKKAEAFDPSYIGDAQALCGKNTADVKGGVGPFGLYVLASSDLEERTAVFFKIFKDGDRHVLLMCHDPTRSTQKENIYKPTFAGFVDVDLEKAKKISLRTLIDHSVVESFGARGKTCITSRVYPSRALGKDAHLFVFNNGAEDVNVSHMNAWEIKSAEMNQELIY